MTADDAGPAEHEVCQTTCCGSPGDICVQTYVAGPAPPDYSFSDYTPPGSEDVSCCKRSLFTAKSRLGLAQAYQFGC